MCCGNLVPAKTKPYNDFSSYMFEMAVFEGRLISRLCVCDLYECQMRSNKIFLSTLPLLND